MWDEQDDNSGKGKKWKTRAKCWMVKWMRMVVNMPYMKTGMQHNILLWNYHGYHAYFLTVFIIFTQFYILFSNIYIWVCVCVFIWGISNNSIPLTHSHHHHLLSLFMLQKYRERERDNHLKLSTSCSSSFWSLKKQVETKPSCHTLLGTCHCFLISITTPTFTAFFSL